MSYWRQRKIQRTGGGAGYRVAVMATLNVGDAAPDFDLPVSGPNRVKLSEAIQKGTVVLLAYVFDFTPG